jgi:hypothetical protein
MSNNPDLKTDSSQSMVYQIRIKGQLGRQWTDWFEGLTITLDENGDTLLTGPIVDQSALHSLLKKVRDLGMPLLSVNATHQYHSTKGEKMNTNRKTAIIVGVLYIIGTVAGILSVVFTSSILNAPDYLTLVFVNKNQIVTGALFILLMGFALALIPALVFPILKKHNEALALGYVIFRGGLETITYIITVISMLLLLPLSQEYGKAGVPGASYFQTLGTLLKGVSDLPILCFVFSLGALIFYYLLYQSNLIPRWISVWGFIAIALHLATGLLIIFGLQTGFDTSNLIMNFPIFLQEMVMAVWLIVKGFNPAAIASLSAKQI